MAGNSNFVRSEEGREGEEEEQVRGERGVDGDGEAIIAGAGAGAGSCRERVEYGLVRVWS